MADKIDQPTPEKIEPHIVTAADDGQRLERYLRLLFPMRTFGEVQKACRTGQIRMNGKRVKGQEKIATDDVIRIPPFWQRKVMDKKENIQKLSVNTKKYVQENIIFEDAHIIVFHKPAGLPAQAGTGHIQSADRLLTRYTGSPIKLVHRLDKVTSGLLLLAKTREAAANLTLQFKQRTVTKIYLAAIQGALERLEGEIDQPLAKFGSRNMPSAEGQSAITEYKVLDAMGTGIALAEVTPHTGRMHQIRSHMAAIGAPIVGDELYGWHDEDHGKWKEDYIMLHAWKLTFTHPASGEEQTYIAKPPRYFPKVKEAFSRG